MDAFLLRDRPPPRRLGAPISIAYTEIPRPWQVTVGDAFSFSEAKRLNRTQNKTHPSESAGYDRVI